MGIRFSLVLCFMIFTLSAEGCFSGCAHRRQLFDGVAVAVIAGRHAFRTALPAFIPAAPVAASESDLWPGVANKCRRFVPYPSPTMPCSVIVGKGGWGGGWTARYLSRNSPGTKELFFADVEEMCLCVGFVSHQLDSGPRLPLFCCSSVVIQVGFAVQEVQSTDKLFLIPHRRNCGS